MIQILFTQIIKHISIIIHQKFFKEEKQAEYSKENSKENSQAQYDLTYSQKNELENLSEAVYNKLISQTNNANFSSYELENQYCKLQKPTLFAKVYSLNESLDNNYKQFPISTDKTSLFNLWIIIKEYELIINHIIEKYDFINEMPNTKQYFQNMLVIFNNIIEFIRIKKKILPKHTKDKMLLCIRIFIVKWMSSFKETIERIIEVNILYKRSLDVSKTKLRILDSKIFRYIKFKKSQKKIDNQNSLSIKDQEAFILYISNIIKECMEDFNP